METTEEKYPTGKSRSRHLTGSAGKKRKDAALRLAGCMIRGTYISLGIGDTDWEIDTALHKCGGEPKTGYGHMAHFHFDGETEMETEKYERLKEVNGDKGAAEGRSSHL